jgi:hypothetical protein
MIALVSVPGTTGGPSMHDNVDQQFERIDAVLGDDAEQDLSTSVQTFFEHL